MVQPIDATNLERSQELDVVRSGALAALPQVQATAPLGHSLVSTIAPAEESFAQISLDMYRAIEAMSLDVAKTTTAQLKLDHQAQEKLHKQKAELVKQELEAMRSQENWNKVANALEYVGYLSMLVTSQHVAGVTKTVLQGAAILGLANRFGADTGLSETAMNYLFTSKQTQEQVQTTLRVVAVGASLAGLFLTWQTRAINALPSLDALVKSMEGVTQVTNLAVGATRMGQKFADRRRAFLQADLKQMDTSVVLGSKEFQQRMQEAQQGNQPLKEATRSIKGLLANLEVHPIED